MDAMAGWEKILVGLLVAACLVCLVRQALRRANREHEAGDEVAGVAGLEVREMTRDGHVRAVGLEFPFDASRRVAVLRPREARLLAEVLRVACAPGRNLAQARFNASRTLRR